MKTINPEILDRQPPADEPAEKALVGCLIYDPACWPRVQPLVDPSDFYGSAYRSIAEVVWNLFASNVTPDVATLLASLKSHRVHPDQPKWEFLIADAVDNSLGINAETYATAIRSAFVKRKIRDVALNAIRQAYEPNADPRAISTLLQADLERIRKLLAGGPQTRETTLQQASFDSIERMEAGITQLVRLGLPGVDEAIGGGMAYGEIMILGARSSHGKSAVALQALHNVSGDGLPALFVSLEMTSVQLGKRAIQFASPVPAERWHLSVRDLIADVSEHFHGREQVYIFEASADKDNHCDTVCQVIRRHVKDYGVRVVVVDYAQLIDNHGKSRYEQMTNTSIAMRQLANECKIVLLLLCQLNREIEKREKFIPKISDIRETGQFEQDADSIIFLVWPHRIDQTRDPKEFNFYIAKNRNRPINSNFVKCVFEPSRQMFSREIPEAEPWSPDEREF